MNNQRGRLGGIRQSTARATIDWFATLSGARGRPRETAELRYRPWQGKHGQLVLIVLDSSGSMLKEAGLAAAKGTLASLLETAYRLRARVGILQFAGAGTHLQVPPQRAPREIFGLLQAITAGGGTPLRRGIVEALQVLDRERRRYPNEEQLLALFTDGRSRANLSDIQIPCRLLIIDTETGPVRLGRCRQLATVLGGEYLALDRLPLKASAAQNHKQT